MNWRAFDLNLLVVFDGLFREGSVTRAGKRLGMSQPALSHALNRATMSCVHAGANT